MIKRTPLALVLGLALPLACGPALATEPPADAPTATAPAASADPGVADQIAAYLRDSPVVQLPTDGEPVGVTSSAAPRQVHGVVDVAVGSHGYRSVYVRSDLPVGQTGTLSIAVGETRGRGYGAYGYGYGYGGPGLGGFGRGQSLAVGLSLGEPATRPCRLRAAPEDEAPCPRPRRPEDPSDSRDGGRILPSNAPE